MAGFNYPGLLADWPEGVDPQDPRTMPQGLLAALSQAQGSPDYTLGSRGLNDNNNGAGMTETPTGSFGPMSARTARMAGGGTDLAMSPSMLAPFNSGPDQRPAPTMPPRTPEMLAQPDGRNVMPQQQPSFTPRTPEVLAGVDERSLPAGFARVGGMNNTTALEGSPEAKAYLANLPAQGAVPAGGAPFNGPQEGKDQPGFLDKLTGVLGGVYGQGGPGDGLINLGLALMSPGNKAENLMRAGQMGQMADYKKSQLMAAQQKQQREMLALQGNMQTLKQAYPNWSQEQLAAAAQNPALVQEAVKSINPSDVTRPLTDPEERAKFGITPDNKNVYQVDRNGKVTAVGTPTTTTNVNTAVNPILKGLGDQFSTMRDEAKSSADAIRAIHNARSQLDADGGIISGAFANNRIALEKVGNLFGITDPSKVTNTETFLTQIKPQVIAMLKATGTNPSNADRDFAAAMSGADPKLAEQTIRRTLDFNEQSHRGNISRFNDMSGQMLATQPDLKQVAPMMTVQAPEPYQSPSPRQPTQTAAPVPGARQAPDGNFYVPDPSRPGKYLKVQ